MSVQVCRLEPEHFHAWERLWRQYQEFYRIDIPASTSLRTWERLFEGGEPVRGHIALVDGQAAGIAHFLLQRSFWRLEHGCYLHDLFVADAFRRRGVARALVTSVCEAAAQLGCDRVHWLTHEENRAAIALYERIAARTGFIQFAMSLPQVERPVHVIGDQIERSNP